MEPMKGRRPMKRSCPERRLHANAWLAALAMLTLVTNALTSPANADSSAASAAYAAPDAGAGSVSVVVSLNLTKYGSVQTIDAGQSVGVRPGIVRVHVGDSIVFVNDDTDHHTATALVGATSFVDDPRWTDDALKSTGSIGPGFWSTGDLAPGQRSAPIVAKAAGTYLFGCFFDYGAGMRGEIVVQP